MKTLPRIYIAGPMTGLPEFNFPAFNAAAALLREAGYKVTNPAEHGLPEASEWKDHVRLAIGRLMACEAVAILPGWESSRGAMLELHNAQRLDYDVRTLWTWLADAQAVAP